MDEGTLLEVIEALYEFPNSGNRWHAHLSHTLREIGLSQLVLTRISGLGGARDAMIILGLILIMS